MLPETYHSKPRLFVNKLLLLAFFPLFAAAVPAFAQIPAKVALSRALTPAADGFTVA